MNLTQAIAHSLQNFPKNAGHYGIRGININDSDTPDVCRDRNYLLARDAIIDEYLLLTADPNCPDAPSAVVTFFAQAGKVPPCLVEPTGSNSTCFGEAWCEGNSIFVLARAKRRETGVLQNTKLEFRPFFVMNGGEAIFPEFPDTVSPIGEAP